MIKKAQLPDI